MKTTYIGGQIVNPTLDYIIFSKGNQILDTVKLDGNNFFHYRTEKIKAGLYFLKHGESQVFFIEPGDSLLIHINTIDFDESLAYSGRGGAKNNLLIDLYLQNETENKNLPKWYALSSTEFDHKIDSLKKIKINKYEEYLDKNNEVAEGFKNVVLANINYDYYSKKEMYGAANRSNPEKFDKHFFDYRKKIDFDQNELKYYYPYYRFMNRYFENMVCSKYANKTPINRNSFEYNYRKIELIDSIVTSDSLKNSLLRYNAMWYLLNAKNAEEETKFFEAYSRMNTDKKNLEEVRKVFDASVKLTAGNPVPNVALVSTDNVVKDLQSIIKAPTVVYFWTSQSTSLYKNIHNRAAELKSKYPEYDFIAINTDTHFKKWRETVKKAKYNPETEFQLENLADAEKKLVLNAMNKVIIVDENGIILEGKTNMFHTNFEELLLGYLNK
ncbi:thioredoxin-like domain-containing protein [Aequorivita todarodis]|uniref:TlpA family protein disulfide reductase n=1 Tax=Aequorivita todarodis TaxID=2036821 RepID=UPI00234FCFC3|nr:thioredoxin-like domain-containing protein [Aequorivita todarodis]MDC8000888.1 thioredoxin-like domain-containing protein [Aequorivita todarodis]